MKPECVETAAADGALHMPDPVLTERCPFAGRRGPEVAAGRLHGFLEEVRAQNAASLLPGLRRLSSKDRTTTMNDYNRGVQHFLSFMSIKFAFYQEIPYKLRSIAHWDEETARIGARECLPQWDKAKRLAEESVRIGVRPRPPHHISRRFCAEGSSLRGCLLLFVEGVRRSDDRLIKLRRQLTKFLFAPVVERNAEGRHSTLKRILARCPRYTGALASLNMRILGMRKFLQSEPAFLEDLCTHAETCRDPFYLMKALGLLGHPSIPSDLRPGGANFMPLLCKIVHRQDTQTQFFDFLSDGADDDFDLREAFADAMMDHGLAGVADLAEERRAQRIDAAGLMRSYGMAHFKETVQRSDFVAAVRQNVPGVAGPTHVLTGIGTMVEFVDAEDKRSAGLMSWRGAACRR